MSFILPQVKNDEVTAEDIPIDIVYQDNDIAVINKPQGMVVHPACGNYTGTLTNGLMYHLDSLSAINGTVRPGIVHRIDKDTSGLLVVAKNDIAHNKLAAQFKEHTITRAYKAVVHGIVPNEKGIIDAPIGRSPSNRKMMCVTQKNSKNAVTHYEKLGINDRFSYLKLVLETGRTHQIRVHMKYIGYPVVGDRLYGYNRKDDMIFEGQLLHAYLLGFKHPNSGKYIEFRSVVPEYFNKVFNIKACEGENNG